MHIDWKLKISEVYKNKSYDGLRSPQKLETNKNGPSLINREIKNENKEEMAHRFCFVDEGESLVG